MVEVTDATMRKYLILCVLAEADNKWMSMSDVSDECEKRATNLYGDASEGVLCLSDLKALHEFHFIEGCEEPYFESSITEKGIEHRDRTWIEFIRPMLKEKNVRSAPALAM